jgi:hypothetical protein
MYKLFLWISNLEIHKNSKNILHDKKAPKVLIFFGVIIQNNP